MQWHIIQPKEQIHVMIYKKIGGYEDHHAKENKSDMTCKTSVAFFLSYVETRGGKDTLKIKEGH